MKLRRFLSVFLLFTLLTVLFPLTSAYAVEDPDIQAKAALLVDTATGAVLYQKNAHDHLPPASITKIMTVLLVLEDVERGHLKMDQSITASTAALAGLPSDGSNADPAIVAGETMTVEDLLYCTMVVSANEACNVLAEAVAGSVSDFVELMNQRAQQLGCVDTHFANTNGYTDPNHYTSAWDIYLITREAMKFDDFNYIASATWKNIAPTNMCDHQRQLHTTNSLLDGWRYSGYQYSAAQGIKTGTTEAAGHCLVADAAKNGRQLLSILLGAETGTDENGGQRIMSFTETVRLFEWGFENFSTRTVLTSDKMIAEIPVALSKETNYVVVHPAYDAAAVLPKDVNADLSGDSLDNDLTYTVDLPESVDAPITAGDALGSITVSYQGTDYVTVPLLAVSDVTASSFLVGKAALKDFFSRTVVKVGLVLLIALIVGVVLLLKVTRNRRRYGNQNRQYRRRNYRGRRF